MAKRRSKQDQERKRLLSEGYTQCRGCDSLLKPKARKCPKCGALAPSTRKALIATGIVGILVIGALAAYVYLPEEEGYTVLPSVIEFAPSGYGALTSCQITATFSRPMDQASVEASFQTNPLVHGTFTWSGLRVTFAPSAPLIEQTFYTVTIGRESRDLQGSPLDSGIFTWSFYTGSPPTERRDVGTGSEDFWIEYPPSHPSSGAEVQHPEWVLSALESGVVMILDHSEGCAPCVQQTAICEAVYSTYSEIEYFDLSSGTDEPWASDAFAAYDPSGGVHYVPLTVVLTKVQSPSGGTAVGWHSWEGVIDQASLSSWIADAISHWNES